MSSKPDDSFWGAGTVLLLALYAAALVGVPILLLMHPNTEPSGRILAATILTSEAAGAALVTLAWAKGWWLFKRSATKSDAAPP